MLFQTNSMFLRPREEEENSFKPSNRVHTALLTLEQSFPKLHGIHVDVPLAARRAEFSDLVLMPEQKKKLLSNLGCFMSALILFLLEDADVECVSYFSSS